MVYEKKVVVCNDLTRPHTYLYNHLGNNIAWWHTCLRGPYPHHKAIVISGDWCHFLADMLGKDIYLLLHHTHNGMCRRTLLQLIRLYLPHEKGTLTHVFPFLAASLWCVPESGWRRMPLLRKECITACQTVATARLYVYIHWPRSLCCHTVYTRYSNYLDNIYVCIMYPDTRPRDLLPLTKKVISCDDSIYRFMLTTTIMLLH